jgi:predicted PurR-regulated permease PerM
MPTDITWPTAWQRKVWFGAVTALSIAVIVALIVLVGTLVVRGLAFLQPLLIPVVTAVILTYLLQPIVTKFCAWGMNKTMAVVLLLFLLLGGVTGIVIWVAPSISNQAVEFGKALPDHTARGEKLLLSSLEWVRSLRQRFDPPAAADAERTIRNEVWAVAGGYIQEMTDWLQRKLPDLVADLVDIKRYLRYQDNVCRP